MLDFITRQYGKIKGFINALFPEPKKVFVTECEVDQFRDKYGFKQSVNQKAENTYLNLKLRMRI
jgi:hypothetical protein